MTSTIALWLTENLTLGLSLMFVLGILTAHLFFLARNERTTVKLSSSMYISPYRVREIGTIILPDNYHLIHHGIVEMDGESYHYYELVYEYILDEDIDREEIREQFFAVKRQILGK